jgi:uncharacterized protein
MKIILEDIREEAKRFFKDMPPSHDWSHVERVYNLAAGIANKENADIFTVSIAALLHDIGREREMADPNIYDHAKIGAEMAVPILAKYNIQEEISKNVIHSIAAHRFRARGTEEPKTLEAKVLFDADKIDSIGAIGIARAYAWAGEKNHPLYSDKDYLGTGYEKDHSPVTEFMFKLNKVYDRMYTTTGKITAHYRTEFMKEFFERIKQESEGGII